MNVVESTRSWLQLFRAHTVILEAPMALIGAAIGVGTFVDPRVGAWLLFGALYHIVGYGMNSYVDWKKGFDKDDPMKQHHPLNTGDIDPETAKKVIYGLTGALVVYLFALTYSSPPAVGLSVLMIVSGLIYNYFGKYTILKFVPISIAHTLVFFILITCIQIA
jgi:UbiA prenyltransferase family.